jgi:hypothetical protein
MIKGKIIQLLSRCSCFLKSKKQPQNIYHNRGVRKKVDNEAIRARIKAQGWNLLEIPIQQKDAKTNNRIVAKWKVIASKGDKSLEVGGSTIDEALKNIGITLGVISRGS